MWWRSSGTLWRWRSCHGDAWRSWCSRLTWSSPRTRNANSTSCIANRPDGGTVASQSRRDYRKEVLSVSVGPLPDLRPRWPEVDDDGLEEYRRVGIRQVGIKG